MHNRRKIKKIRKILFDSENRCTFALSFTLPHKTMKKILPILLAAISFVACENNGFTVSGTIDRECDTIFIRGDKNNVLYTAVPVTDGKYQWEGTSDSIFIAEVCYGDKRNEKTRIIVEPGKIELNIGAASEEDPKPFYATGTPWNDKVSQFSKEAASFFEPIIPQLKKYRELSDEEKKEVEEKYDEADKARTDYLLNILRENSQNMVGVYFLSEFRLGDPAQELSEILPSMQEAFPENTWVKKVADLVKVKMGTAVGQPYTDLTMDTPEGEKLSLSDVIPQNKYTLVDFWASWCGPCCKELPNVKAMWEKYNKLGFQVVGVSFDQKAENWKEAIANYGLGWPQMSDLKGWQCAASDAYGINSIPSTLLVDKDGKIVAKNLRGEELQNKLKELFGE